MAKRGGKRHTKRIAVPNVVPIHNKKRGGRFIIKPNPGPHGKEEGYALAVFLRDVLSYSSTLREVSFALKKGYIKVNGKVIREEKFPVGLMDVVEVIPADKAYRITVDEKGRLVPKEIKDKSHTLLQVKNKHSVRGGVFQLTFHNGWNILSKDNSVKVQDSAIFNLEEKKVEQWIPLKEGVDVLVVKGRLAGLKGKVVSLPKEKGGVAVISSGGEEHRVKRDYIMPIGGVDI